MNANLQLRPSLKKNWRNWRWMEMIVASIIVVLVAGGLAYRLAPRNTPLLSALPDPAAPSMMRYIQAHEALSAPAAIDPAVSATQSYIRAHEVLSAPAAIDPAASATQSYIQAHEALNAPAAIDPATQSVLDYLRVHAN
mgnify:CR=1 FL=1